MSITLRFILLAGLCAAFCSCADDKPADNREQVSTIPWNRPEKWEGQGMLGGFQTNH